MNRILVVAIALASTTAAAAPTVVIGVDGMTFDLVRPMIERGELPTLAKLSGNGASAILTSEKPMRSPALWTTVATGQPRRVHQIYDFVTGSHYWPKSARNQAQRLVTSSMRHAPALWNLASNAGKSSLVVGWLNTWPAEPVRGVMVAPYVALGETRQTSIKGRIYQNAQQQTHPESAFARVLPIVVPSEEVSDELVGQIVAVPPADSPLYNDIPLLRRYLYTVRWSLASGLTNTAISSRSCSASRTIW